MKHLKRFNESNTKDLGELIAIDLLPRFEKMRAEGNTITVDHFDQYMKDRGASPDLYHSVMNHLVNMGFDFDLETKSMDDMDYGEPYLK